MFKCCCTYATLSGTSSIVLYLPVDTKTRLSKLDTVLVGDFFCHAWVGSVCGASAADADDWVSAGVDDCLDWSDFSKIRGVCDTNRTFCSDRIAGNLAVADFVKRRIIFKIEN